MAPRKKPRKKTVSPRSMPDTGAARQRAVPMPPPIAGPFPVVGIGSSAGGLEAMEELFRHMPANPGMAFVVVPHQHPDHVSLLPELLARLTRMPVVHATDGVSLEPDHVYVAPPGGQVAVLHGVLRILKRDGGAAVPSLPIDSFLRSLAGDLQHRAICIILSGTGTDGTLGLKAIKGESGMAMVQSLESAKYAGMPSSAIGTSLADYILPPARMAEQLIAYTHGSYLRGAAATPEAAPTRPWQKVLALLRDRTGHDFSSYKPNTIRRRIERRMNVQQSRSVDDYAAYLQDNPHEIDILFKELLITVTSFFRDPQAFEALARKALMGLVESRSEADALRVWIPGCASGEEAYSLAILLRECMEASHKTIAVQLFGTDLDASSIEAARVGIYPEGIAVDVSPMRLQRNFTRVDGGYRIRQEIRDMLVFAPHNLIKDPPFTKLDLLSCRNLLIYLAADLQKRLIPLFHYALKPDGILFLGSSETIGAFTDLFSEADKKWKIYRRREALAADYPMIDFPLELPAHPAGAERRPDVARGKVGPLPNLVDQLLLSRFAPATAVVNERGDIVYIHGRTGTYLEPAAGQQPQTNILDMAREGLRTHLAGALRQAARHDGEVICENVRVRANGGFTHVNFSVARIAEPEAIRGLLLVTFQPAAPPPAAPKSRAKSERTKKGRATAVSSGMSALQRELDYTKESLQRTVEELEASNEEIKSTNEELQSTNEELQSANEELETSKEEMQSLNEELSTVNAELESKVSALSAANAEMQNLLNSTDVATLFVDNALRVQRYTETAKTLVNLIATDVGRPLPDLVTRLRDDTLLADIRDVLRTLVFKEREVQATDGRWFFMRILPYRTVENLLEGVVITFVDIDRLKSADRASHESSLFFRGIVDSLPAPVVVVDQSQRVVFANQAFGQLVHMTAKKCEGELLANVGHGEFDTPELRRLLAGGPPPAGTAAPVEMTGKTGRRRLRVGARSIAGDDALAGLVLLTIEEVDG